MRKEWILDGWSPVWRRWWIRHGFARSRKRDHRHEIGRTVRAALRQLEHQERQVIERYYFDGWTYAQIAEEMFVSQDRVRTVHRWALGQLRTVLTPFVRTTFGIDTAKSATCPICIAEWRGAAEAILDEKSASVTWGQMVKRIERATGWRAPTPQVLIGHQKHHRGFEPMENTIESDTTQPREDQ